MPAKVGWIVTVSVRVPQQRHPQDQALMAWPLLWPVQPWEVAKVGRWVLSMDYIAELPKRPNQTMADSRVGLHDPPV